MTEVANTAQLVDAYIAKRTERLLAAKVVENLEKEEKALKGQLIKICIDSKSKALGGSKGVVNYKRDYKPTVNNWEHLYQYIRENNAFELLQRRLGESAIEERWEDEIVIPGVSTWPVDNLTISGKE